MLWCPIASAARRLPSAKRLPTPSRRPTSSIARSIAAPLPNASHASPTHPRPTPSIAKAIVPPALIVSMPRSSHNLDARSTSRLCDALGIDTNSAGGTIAFAMECVERGWLDEPWLMFGNGDALLRAIGLIGRRQGLGNLLAEGSRRAAQTIGHHSIAFAPQVKGLEIPGYE